MNRSPASTSAADLEFLILPAIRSWTLQAGLQTLVTDADRDPNLAGTRFLVEPGRFLVGEAGVYLTRIVDIKSSRGTTFAVTDGGMNHHLAASGNLGQVLRRDFPVIIANRAGAANKLAVSYVQAIQ